MDAVTSIHRAGSDMDIRMDIRPVWIHRCYSLAEHSPFGDTYGDDPGVRFGYSLVEYSPFGAESAFMVSLLLVEYSPLGTCPCWIN